MSASLCWSGDGRKSAYTDSVTLRAYCSVCASSELTSSQNVALQFMKDITPFEIGNRVECRTVGVIYDGTGKIVQVSTDLRDGGTEMSPAYLVRMDSDGKDLWYTGKCLTLLEDWQEEVVKSNE